MAEHVKDLQYSSYTLKLGLSTCFRLYSQLRDMESAFDGFFHKHRLKFHQYLQLLRYEQRFQEVNRERSMSFSGRSLAFTVSVYATFSMVCLDGDASAGSDL